MKTADLSGAVSIKPLEGDSLVCVACHGKPAEPVLTFFNTGEDWTKHYQDYVIHPCQVCNGTGAISLAVATRYHDGKKHRAERVARQETLFHAAKRLGVTSAQLSAYEHGYADLPAPDSRAETAKHEGQMNKAVLHLAESEFSPDGDAE